MKPEATFIENGLDAESKVSEWPEDHRTELRLWLRLLTCVNLIETEIRHRLRQRFGITLPRFDLMAQLERSPDGLLLGDLSKRMMVSNGNVTGLVDRLAKEGLIERVVVASDRRAVRVRLTRDGHAVFDRMAAEHADWVAELLEGLPAGEVEDLWRRLGRLKTSTLSAIERRLENR